MTKFIILENRESLAREVDINELNETGGVGSGYKIMTGTERENLIAALRDISTIEDEIIVINGLLPTQDQKNALEEMTGHPPSSTNKYTVKSYVDLAIIGANAVGTIISFAADSPPTSYLECNGATLSTDAYPDLYAAIGGTWGIPGSGLFKIPDLRGEFIRGWDHGRGIDSGRSFASYQADQMQKLTGNFIPSFAPDKAEGFWSSATGAFTRSTLTPLRATPLWSHNAYQRVQMDFDSANSPNARVSSTTSGETRPRNRAILFAIKYE